MVLPGTSAGERNRHIQVLAVLAKTIGQDIAAAHADEILHGEESVEFNNDCLKD
jgi:hypothetical protein